MENVFNATFSGYLDVQQRNTIHNRHPWQANLRINHILFDFTQNHLLIVKSWQHYISKKLFL